MVPLRQGSHGFFRNLVHGRTGLYELAREMTSRFEREDKGRLWEDGLEGAVREFCEDNKL